MAETKWQKCQPEHFWISRRGFDLTIWRADGKSYPMSRPLQPSA
jgi:hypothetical protein